MNTFLHDAEERTESWRRRHSPEAIKQLGVWRWKGIQDNAGLIFNEITGKRVIDFGGADGPLGFRSEICDIKTVNTRDETLIEYLCFETIPFPIQVIFTSHTLEHIENLEELLKQFYERLEPQGSLIVHVPAYTCERWRAENYDNPNQGERHKHTFCLSCDEGSKTIERRTTMIDRVLELEGFMIEFAKYVGDDSILIIARKP